MTRVEQKRCFVKALAQFLAGEQAHRGVRANGSAILAVEWVILRSTTPLAADATVEEAEKVLTKFLE